MISGGTEVKQFAEICLILEAKFGDATFKLGLKENSRKLTKEVLFSLKVEICFGIIHSVRTQNFFRKIDISYPLIRSRTWAHQALRLLLFQKKITCVLNV